MTAVTLAHTQLLSALLDEKPHQILGPADSCDIAERREHLERIAKLLGAYVFDIGSDTKSNIPLDRLGHFDNNAFIDGLFDLINDTITGPLQTAEELLIEDMEMAS